MLVFNEGVPRAGKSYDAVKSHILPALKKGRRVFARLNGLRPDRIAAHLKMSEDDVRSLLVQVETKDVRDVFACSQDETGKWCIPDQFKDALVVIDEVHEFYVNERKPLPPAIENFWALLGQNGGDAVILTQWINRLHQAVKARIEKKHVFQKLTAVGFKNKYRVTYYHTTSPGKFEKVGGQTLKYDPAIFPLYDGYAPGAENVEVYEEGGKNVWGALAVKGVVFLIVGVLGAWGFVSFFTSGKDDKPAAKPVATADAPAVGQTFKPGEAIPMAGQVAGKVAEKADPLADLTPEQRYVMELANKGRIRLAALAQVGGQDRAWVEWVDTSNIAVEFLDLVQLRALGFDVTVQPYGVRLAAGKHVQVATPWPREAPTRSREAETYNTSTAGLPAGAAGFATAGSEAGGTGAAPISGGVIGRAKRASGTFPENEGYESESYSTVKPRDGYM